MFYQVYRGSFGHYQFRGITHSIVCNSLAQSKGFVVFGVTRTSVQHSCRKAQHIYLLLINFRFVMSKICFLFSSAKPIRLPIYHYFQTLSPRRRSNNSFQLNITVLIVWAIILNIENMFHCFKFKFSWWLARINGHKTNYKLVLTLIQREIQMAFVHGYLKRPVNKAHPPSCKQMLHPLPYFGCFDILWYI